MHFRLPMYQVHHGVGTLGPVLAFLGGAASMAAMNGGNASHRPHHHQQQQQQQHQQQQSAYGNANMNAGAQQSGNQGGYYEYAHPQTNGATMDGSLSSSPPASTLPTSSTAPSPTNKPIVCHPKCSLIAAAVASAIIFFTMARLGRYETQALLVSPGETLRLANPTALLTSSLNVQIPTTGNQNGQIDVYGFPRSCPSLTGTPYQYTETGTTYLAKGEYTYSTFQLTKGSSIYLTTTLNQGSVEMYYYDSRYHGSLIDDIQRQRWHSVDHSEVMALATQSHTLSADDGAEEVSWTNLKNTRTYSFVYYNNGNSDTTLKVNYDITEATYDVSSSTKKALETCSLDTSEYLMHCNLPVTNDVRCWIATSPSNGGNNNNGDGDGDDGGERWANATKLRVSASRNWGLIIGFSIAPLFLVMLLQQCSNGSAQNYQNQAQSNLTGHVGSTMPYQQMNDGSNGSSAAAYHHHQQQQQQQDCQQQNYQHPHQNPTFQSHGFDASAYSTTTPPGIAPMPVPMPPPVMPNATPSNHAPHNTAMPPTNGEFVSPYNPNIAEAVAVPVDSHNPHQYSHPNAASSIPTVDAALTVMGTSVPAPAKSSNRY